MSKGTNAKSEFISHIGNINKTVLCAVISTEDDHKILLPTSELYIDSVFELTTGWSDDDFNSFLNRLDFNYDSGYGRQELFGTIWYTDGTWSSRSEYDGSENWTYNSCPDIPEVLNRKDKVRDQLLDKIL